MHTHTYSNIFTLGPFNGLVFYDIYTLMCHLKLYVVTDPTMHTLFIPRILINCTHTYMMHMSGFISGFRSRGGGANAKYKN